MWKVARIFNILNVRIVNRLYCTPQERLLNRLYVDRGGIIKHIAF